MAKNPTDNRQKINLSLEERSQQEMQRFLKTMQNIKTTVDSTEKAFEQVAASIKNNADYLKSLKQDARQFKLIADAMKQVGIRQQGAGGYMEGLQYQTNRQVENVRRLGSEQGQVIDQQKRMLTLARQGSTFLKNEATVRQAIQLKLGMQARTVQKITDIDKARNLVKAAELRMNLEIADGNRKQAKSAERILGLAQQRLKLLEDERKKTEELARTQERRAKRIDQNLRGDRELERSQQIANRRNTLGKITGDGGAGLFAVQTNVMANYVALNAARNTLTEGVDFTVKLDESLRNLQAITVTTDENMNLLKEEILEVSEATKFFATDIADATVTLGQAGFSTKEIMDSIRAVSLLATATGTELSKSVDLTTSILGVFRMESAQMSGVANTLTAAVNQSKLNIDKLALGLQYAGNTASQSGVSFEELTATLGAMANAGIRSGSTLGTGMRQILISLQKPSGKFLENLNRLGITMDQVNLKTNGLYGVMKNLKEGGFSAADAIGSFEVRAAAAFNALSGNLDQVVDLEAAFLNSAAAAKANETQMRALANQGRRLQANLGAVVSTGLEPLKFALRDTFSALADMLQEWRQYPVVLQRIVTGLAAFSAALLVVRTAWLAVNLLGMVSGFKTLVASSTAATAAVTKLAAVFTPLRAVMIAAAAGAAIYYAAMGRLDKEVQRANASFEKAQTNFDDARGRMEEYGSQIEMTSGRIEELTNRSETLSKNEDLLALETQKVREQFREMGVDLDENVDSVEELIDALRALRGQLNEKYTLQIGATEESLALLLKANRDQQAAVRNSAALSPRQDRQLRAGGRNTRAANLLNEFANTEDATIDQLYAMETERKVLLELAKEQSGRNRSDKLARQRLEALGDQIKKNIELKRTELSVDRQAAVLERQRLNTENRLQNKGIVDQADSFKEGAFSKFQGAGAGVTLPLRRLELAKAAQRELKTESDALKNEILKDENLLPEVQQALVRQIDNAMSEIQKEMGRILEVAQEAAETREELKRLRLEARENGLSRELEDTSDSGRIDEITAARIGVANSDRDAQLEKLAVETGDRQSEAFKAQAASINEEHKARVQQILEQGNAQLAAAVDLSIETTRLQIAELERQLERTADPSEREAIRDNIATMVTGIAEEKKEQATLLITNLDQLALELSTIDAELAETLADLSDANQEDQQRAAKQGVEAAQAALDAALRLGDQAINNKELAEAQIKAKKALAKLMEALRKQAQVDTEAGDETEEVNTGQAEAAIDAARAKIFSNNRTNTRRLNPKRRGGSNPYKKKRDEIDQLIDDLKSKLEVAENYLSVGETVNVEFDNVLDTALTKVETISDQIDTFRAKMAAGGLTTGEQKSLNELIDKQARLTSFIRQEEERIALLKLQQGKYTEGIQLTAQSWIRDNLSISKTIQNGITGALGNAKSALTDFFTSWTDGTKKGTDAFRDMAASIIKSVQNIFAEMLVVYLLQKAMNWVDGAFGLNLKLPAAQGTVVEKRGAPKPAAMGTMVPGNLSRDSVDYKLMPGEAVLTRSAVQMIGKDEIKRMNSMGNKAVSQSPRMERKQDSSKGDGVINFYLVDERSKVGAMGPNDVLAVVSDDIARGGTTKKLIKSVQAGNL